ncbi:MAG: crotonase/enoyl-CoA hydratase family protein [Chloroflexota bacterium]
MDVDNQIAHVRLNRPDKANSLNQTAWDELEAIFTELDSRSDVRAVVLSGEGKHFCAGIALEMLMGMTQQFDTEDEGRKREIIRRKAVALQRSINAIEQCSKPVLAVIHGACVGGAIDVTSACDMRYCTQDAFFSIEEINVGIVADLGTLQRLPKLIGEGIVRELAFTGRRMLAEEALQRQFVNEVFEDREALLDGVFSLARMIASRAPLAIRGTKHILNFSRDRSVEDGLAYVATWNAATILSNDVAEAIGAKLAGRDPQFED